MGLISRVSSRTYSCILEEKHAKMGDASYATTMVVNQMKEQVKEQHLQSLMADIVEGCTPLCTRRSDRPVDEKCIEKCTSAYIDTWDKMSRVVVPKLKEQMGLRE